jgi:hypothetical protein
VFLGFGAFLGFGIWASPCSVWCANAPFLCCLADLVFGDLGRIFGLLILRLIVVFVLLYILLGFARMDASKDRLVRNITIAATALCAALLLTTDYGPQPHALTPVFATPLCVSVEYSGTSFSLWNCVPRFAESLPVSVVFQDYLLNRGLLDSLCLCLSLRGVFWQIFLPSGIVFLDLESVYPCLVFCGAFFRITCWIGG